MSLCTPFPQWMTFCTRFANTPIVLDSYYLKPFLQLQVKFLTSATSARNSRNWSLPSNCRTPLELQSGRRWPLELRDYRLRYRVIVWIYTNYNTGWSSREFLASSASDSNFQCSQHSFTHIYLLYKKQLSLRIMKIQMITSNRGGNLCKGAHTPKDLKRESAKHWVY